MNGKRENNGYLCSVLCKCHTFNSPIVILSTENYLNLQLFLCLFWFEEFVILFERRKKTSSPQFFVRPFFFSSSTPSFSVIFFKCLINNLNVPRQSNKIQYFDKFRTENHS